MRPIVDKVFHATNNRRPSIHSSIYTTGLCNLTDYHSWYKQIILNTCEIVCCCGTNSLQPTCLNLDLDWGGWCLGASCGVHVTLWWSTRNRILTYTYLPLRDHNFRPQICILIVTCHPDYVVSTPISNRILTSENRKENIAVLFGVYVWKVKVSMRNAAIYEYNNNW
jgi:hypothetical protein